MEIRVAVRLQPSGDWLPALLTDQHAEASHGRPVIVIIGELRARTPAEVVAVDCAHVLGVTDPRVQAFLHGALEAGFRFKRQSMPDDGIAPIPPGRQA